MINGREKVFDFARKIQSVFEKLNKIAGNPITRYLSVIVSGRKLIDYYKNHYDSVEMGLAEDGRSVRIRKILGKIGVPTALPEDLAEDKLINLMRHDKKAVDKWPRFVLLSRIGQVYCQNGQYAVEVERRIVEKVLRKLREN